MIKISVSCFILLLVGCNSGSAESPLAGWNLYEGCQMPPEAFDSALFVDAVELEPGMPLQDALNEMPEPTSMGTTLVNWNEGKTDVIVGTENDVVTSITVSFGVTLEEAAQGAVPDCSASID